MKKNRGKMRKIDPDSHKENQKKLYDQKPLDDIGAGAGYFGFNKPKLIRDLRYAYWVRRLGINRGDTVLDVGCNAGANLEKIRRTYGCTCTGIDLSPRTIAAGKKAYPKINLSVGDVEKLSFADATFDAVISFETFEHVPNPTTMLAECARVVKPGGKILIYTISRNNIFTWHWWQYHLTRGRYGTGALRDHLPELMISVGEFKSWVRASGARIIGWEYFHSFFTLLHDEVWTHLLASLTGKIKKNYAKQPSVFDTSDTPRLPSARLRLYALWLYCVDILLSILDFPWQLCGQSDGFFALCIKKNE